MAFSGRQSQPCVAPSQRLFGSGRTDRAYGYYRPNPWAMAGEMAGAAGSAQMGGVAQQMIGNGLNRPPTMEIRPADQFNVMVTADLAFRDRIRTDSYTNPAPR